MQVKQLQELSKEKEDAEILFYSEHMLFEIVGLDNRDVEESNELYIDGEIIQDEDEEE